eukprot:GHVS01005142.1.p1 GENE.GHVS01005142.1~~GHVS01005142.1.p1  ORF type:complete len:499 (+),score=86.23 GHVS01005142.1:291-1787(+)
MSPPPSCSVAALTDLASASLGSKILFSTDEWFATADNLLSPSPPIFKAGEFTEYGKWMDGWETRRRRTAGFDFCIIQLGREGVVRGFEINTKFFTGNFAPRVTVQAAFCPDLEKHIQSVTEEGEEGSRYTQEARDKLGSMGTGVSRECRDWFERYLRNAVQWKTLLSEEPLGSGSEETCQNLFELDPEEARSTMGCSFTHIKLNMLPDGGIARFRVFGEVLVLSRPFHLMKTCLTGVRYLTPTAPPPPPPPLTTTTALMTTSSPPAAAADKNDVEMVVGDKTNVGLPVVECNEHDEIDLSAALNGGICLCWSNAHYGEPKNLLLRQGGENMGGGWETARSLLRPSVLVEDPSSGRIRNFPAGAMDWVVIKLAARGEIRRVEVDTQHFKGNPPESVEVDGLDALDILKKDVIWQKRFFEETENAATATTSTSRTKRFREDTSIRWKSLIPRTRLEADAMHTLIVPERQQCTHVRFRIFPDGGIMRVRVWAALLDRPSAL